MQKIEVKIPANPQSSYAITVGDDFLDSIIPQIKTLLPNRELFIITDANVVKAGLLKKLTAGVQLPCYVITPAGEQSKHIGTITKIIEEMETNALGRDCAVVALGGGTVGDMAGFAAAIYKRGVPVIQIPTTTVAQADSAIGGKTGVDSSISKNAYGAFYHPAAVFVDVATLKSLDEKQFNCGLVESIKHALIADSDYFDYLQKNVDALCARQVKPLEYIAMKNCQIKVAVVEEDPYEKNKRRILNYGHTIGHAIESASEYEILHGQAVAIGIIAANIIEQKLGLNAKERLAQLKQLFAKLNISLRIPAKIKKEQILDILSRDKKAIGKWPRFILLEKTGKVLRDGEQYAYNVKREIVEETIDIILKEKY
ncbi:MAG TPA: 3-dehydroquinate synthase [Phycisphaerales bacterium]|nr:MAG: 3-dehydroquinate synthase [Planctomycetes bacterium GWC2_45_44]HBG77395.1 3-dehydroquinate synthase [Phycisphaerales bacterium]HBR19588.1 3-dehydroquinate synthase [Phycisphaerales bacterium]